MVMSWKDKKNHLYALIKSISDHYGGDDTDWLRDYARDMVETNKEDLDKAILCFEQLSSGLKIKTSHEAKKSIKIDLCEMCGYRIVFCSCT